MGVRLRLSLIALTATVAGGAQTAPASFEFRIPDRVQPEQAMIRYVITGDDLGGWVATRANVPTYRISIEGHRTSSIRAIFYAPGCAIETLDASLSNASELTHAFGCQQIGTTSIAGKVRTNASLSGRDIRIRAKYVAQWAPGFLGIAKEVPLVIPLKARVPIAADGTFLIAIPDLASDPHADRGELQLWATDAQTGSDVAHLIPLGAANSGNRSGSLKIQTSYPAEIPFDTCGVGNPETHLIRRDGFTIRGNDPRESCSH